MSLKQPHFGAMAFRISECLGIITILAYIYYFLCLFISVLSHAMHRESWVGVCRLPCKSCHELVNMPCTKYRQSPVTVLHSMSWSEWRKIVFFWQKWKYLHKFRNDRYAFHTSLYRWQHKRCSSSSPRMVPWHQDPIKEQVQQDSLACRGQGSICIAPIGLREAVIGEYAWRNGYCCTWKRNLGMECDWLQPRRKSLKTELWEWYLTPTGSLPFWAGSKPYPF